MKINLIVSMTYATLHPCVCQIIINFVRTPPEQNLNWVLDDIHEKLIQLMVNAPPLLLLVTQLKLGRQTC